MSKATKAFLIGRTSRERPEERLHRYSIEVQMTEIEKWAKENNLEVVGNFPIPNETGFKKSRKKFNAMLQQAKEKQASIGEPLALVFTEADRLSRNVFSKEIFDLVRLARDEGKFELHFSEDEEILRKDSPPKDWVEFTNEINRSWNESAKKGRKLKKIYKRKREEGLFLGWTATGYLNVATTNEQGEIVKKIILDKDRAPLIEEMFQLFADEDLTTEELTRRMIGRGLTVKPRKKSGKPKEPQKGDILWMLHNVRYLGCLERLNEETGKIELVKATNLEPIVTKELFEKVQKKLNDTALRMKVGKRRSSTKFFKFRGLIKCHFCGCSLTPDDFSTKYKGRKKPKELKVFYRCSYAKRNVDPDWYMKKFGTKNCPMESWDEKEIEADIKETFSMMSYDKERMEEIRVMLNQEYKKTITFTQGQRKVLEAKINEKEELKGKLVDSMAMDEMVDVKMELKERIKQIRNELESLNKDLRELGDEEELNTDEFLNTITLCSDLSQQYDKLTPVRQRELCMIAFESIEAMKGWKVIKGKKVRVEGLDIMWREPFSTMLESGLLKAKDDTPKMGGSGKGQALHKTKKTTQELSGHGFSRIGCTFFRSII